MGCHVGSGLCGFAFLAFRAVPGLDAVHGSELDRAFMLVCLCSPCNYYLGRQPIILHLPCSVDVLVSCDSAELLYVWSSD